MQKINLKDVYYVRKQATEHDVYIKITEINSFIIDLKIEIIIKSLHFRMVLSDKIEKKIYLLY